MTVLRDITLTARSGNAKTGPIPVTSRPMHTCPDGCPFLPTGPFGGCYGTGRIFAAAERGSRDLTREDALEILSHRNPAARIMRDRVVGDIAGPDGRPDIDYLETVADISSTVGLIPFGYSHMWEDLTADDIARIRAAGYVLNASTETAEDAARAIDAGLPATIVTDTVPERAVINGKRVITCPAETHATVDCHTCGLCARAERPTIVRFHPHGTAVKRARAAIDAAETRERVPELETAETLAEIARAAERDRAAGTHRAATRKRLYGRIRDAYRSGIGTSALARAAGISRQRIAQLVEGIER